MTPSYDWITTVYGLPDFDSETVDLCCDSTLCLVFQFQSTCFHYRYDGAGVSNIVFSWGEYDPWGSAAIHTSPSPERSLVSVYVEGGAHHIDLSTWPPLATVLIIPYTTPCLPLLLALL